MGLLELSCELSKSLLALKDHVLDLHANLFVTTHELYQLEILLAVGNERYDLSLSD